MQSLAPYAALSPRVLPSLLLSRLAQSSNQWGIRSEPIEVGEHLDHRSPDDPAAINLEAVVALEREASLLQVEEFLARHVHRDLFVVSFAT